MSNKKKIIIICSMVVLLIAAGYLNVILNKTSAVNNTDDTSTTVSFFAAYRTDRETARAQEFSYLDAIIASASSTDEAILTAETMKQDLVEVIETELVLEGLIKAKGFDDAVVTMSTNNINVIVHDAELISEEVAQILNVITTETGYSASKIVIVPYSTT